MEFQEVIIADEKEEVVRLYTAAVHQTEEQLKEFLHDVARGRVVADSPRKFAEEVRDRLRRMERLGSNFRGSGWIEVNARGGIHQSERLSSECTGSFVLNITRNGRVQVWEALPKVKPAVSTFRVVVTKTHTKHRPAPVCRPSFRDAVGRGLREVYGADSDLSFTYEITEE